jgi:thioredoxin 1
MKSKHYAAAVLAIGLLVFGGLIAFIIDHRPETSNSPFITEVTTRNFSEQVLKSPLPVYVEFYVEGNCKPCEKQAPIVEKLAAEYQGKVRFVRVEARKNQEISQAVGVRGVPTHLFINPVTQDISGSSGFLDEAAMRAFIQKGLEAKPDAAPVAPNGPPATPDTTQPNSAQPDATQPTGSQPQPAPNKGTKAPTDSQPGLIQMPAKPLLPTSGSPDMMGIHSN